MSVGAEVFVDNKEDEEEDSGVAGVGVCVGVAAGERTMRGARRVRRGCCEALRGGRRGEGAANGERRSKVG